MSNFIDNVRFCLSGKEKATTEPLKTKISTKPENPELGPRIKEHFVYVEWKRSVFCSNKDFPMMLENIVKELREDIYGDLKRRMIRLERSLYEHDFNTAQMEIRDMTKEIFG